MQYIAHIRPSTGEIQTVLEHNTNTGHIAGNMLELVGLRQTGECAGGGHDMGKAKDEFNGYMIHGGKRGSVNHTFAFVRWLFLHYHRCEDSVQYIVAEILAVAAGSHHGLFDVIGPDGNSGFKHRLSKKGIGYEEVLSNLSGELPALQKKFEASVKELEPMLLRIQELADMRGDCPDVFYEGEVLFYTGFLARFVLSALVDADRRDTAEFMNGVVYPAFPAQAVTDQFWDRQLSSLESHLASLPCVNPIDQARREISDACKAAAGMPPGVFQLCVPTGGGKTLAGLRFALAHALTYHMQRMVFTAPLLTIIDQNANAMREALTDDAGLLEHHSNVVNLSGRSWQEHVMLSEGWDAQIIVTTAVQFLEVLFSGDMSPIRRMHSLGRSVIVLDEVQAMPPRFLTLFSLAINFLSYVCHASVILCSATQPCLQKISHSVCVPVTEIPIPTGRLSRVFRRTKLIYKGRHNKIQVMDLAMQNLHDYGSVLVVCNKKSQAAELAHGLSERFDNVYHLSGGMCQSHRRKVLDAIRDDLANNRPVICVSTQVIEAGVDISFGSGIRFLAGLDHIIQTAGRINRNGLFYGLAPLYIIAYEDEDLRKLPDIWHEQAAFLEFYTEFERRPDDFDNCLDSRQSIDYYYQALYKICDINQEQDYVLKDGSTLYDLLSLNTKYCKDKPEHFLRQAFKTAGEAFTVFGNQTVDVIVDYEYGRELILELNSQKARDDLGYARKLLKDARRYTVSVFRNVIDRMVEEGESVVELPGGALGVFGFYDSVTGFSAKQVSGGDAVMG